MSGCCKTYPVLLIVAVFTSNYLQQHVQLVLRHHHPQPVTGVHHEYDPLGQTDSQRDEHPHHSYLTVPVVVFPEVPVPPLPGHVEGSEANISV